MRTAHRLRLAAILALGAFGVHQLRYLIAFGDAAGHELARQGHGYMTDLTAPLAVLILAAALATLIRGTEGATPTRAPLARRIAVFAAALFAIYIGQESLEGLISGHPLGPGAVLAHGGWIALPLAVAIGALSALLARLLENVEHVIAVVHAERSSRSRPPASRGRALPARGPRLPSTPLAFGLARRPPPPAPA
jgi:hypothetical protein